MSINIINRFAKRFGLSSSSAPSSRPSKKRQKGLPYQSLEPRRLLAVFTVDTLADNVNSELDGQISLREAITAANTDAAFGDAHAGDSGTDYIQFAPSIIGQTITLDGAELEITDSVVIRGGDGGVTFGAQVTIDAGGQSRIFTVDTDQRVAFSRLTLTGGNAPDGGAVFTQGGGQVQFFGSTISNNRATNTFAGGGGIFNFDSRIFLSLSSVRNNFTHGYGGGILSFSGTVQLSESSSFSNTAHSGGGIAIFDGALYLSNSGVSFNELSFDLDAANRDAAGLVVNDIIEDAELMGGGIALLGSNPTSVIISSDIRENTAQYGGGIFIETGGRAYLAGEFSNVSFNQAVGSTDNDPTGGGGVYSLGLIRATGVVFEGNSTSSSSLTSSGGAISSVDGNVILHRTWFAENKAEDGGAAIDAEAGRLSISDSRFVRNTAGLLSPVEVLDSDGGAIRLSSSTNARINNAVFRQNIAGAHGGAISISASPENSKSLRVTNSEFINNRTLPGDTGALNDSGGGAIYNDSGTLNVFSSTFTSNSAFEAIGLGGAIYSSKGALAVGGSSFFNNSTEGSGGGLAITGGGSAVVYESNFGSEIQQTVSETGGNSARRESGTGNSGDRPNRGGAIFVDGEEGDVTSLRIQGASFAGNASGDDGGALWAGENTQVGMFNSRLRRTRFIGNRALAQDGGGVFLRSNDVRIVDAIFEENSARDGGGIYSDGGQLTLVRSEITSNEARRSGDDFYDDSDFFANFGSTIDDVFEA